MEKKAFVIQTTRRLYNNKLHKDNDDMFSFFIQKFNLKTIFKFFFFLRNYIIFHIHFVRLIFFFFVLFWFNENFNLKLVSRACYIQIVACKIFPEITLHCKIFMDYIIIILIFFVVLNLTYKRINQVFHIVNVLYLQNFC